jgi:hypothetical protein
MVRCHHRLLVQASSRRDSWSPYLLPAGWSLGVQSLQLEVALGEQKLALEVEEETILSGRVLDCLGSGWKLVVLLALDPRRPKSHLHPMLPIGVAILSLELEQLRFQPAEQLA